MVCVFGGACRRSRSSLWLLEVSQLTKNVSWQSLSVASQAAIQILMMSVFARHVSPHEFGILAVANIYLAFVTLFSTDGISAFLVHEEELEGRNGGACLCCVRPCGKSFVGVVLVIGRTHCNVF